MVDSVGSAVAAEWVDEDEEENFGHLGGLFEAFEQRDAIREGSGEASAAFAGGASASMLATTATAAAAMPITRQVSFNDEEGGVLTN